MNDSDLNFVKGSPDQDGIHDIVEFNEWECPHYWERRRAIRGMVEKMAPFCIAAMMFLAFLAVGFIETNF